MEHYNEFDKPDHYRDQITWLKDAGFRQIDFVFKEEHWIHLRATK